MGKKKAGSKGNTNRDFSNSAHSGMEHGGIEPDATEVLHPSIDGAVSNSTDSTRDSFSDADAMSSANGYEDSAHRTENEVSSKHSLSSSAINSTADSPSHSESKEDKADPSRIPSLLCRLGTIRRAEDSVDCFESDYDENPVRKSRPAHKKKRKHVFLKLFIVFALALIVAVTVFAIRFFKIDEWHVFDSSLITEADRSAMVYASDGTLLSVCYGKQNRIPVSIDTLPEYVRYAFISAEDARFYSHNGVDIIRIFGAALADIKAGSLDQGASTIGQQLIKLSHLTSEKTFERKIEEAYLSIQMEHEFSKDEILEHYMNFVYFGGGYYGIEAASLGYFGVHASSLTPAQAAQLAGVLKAPSNYAPHLNMEKSLSRRNTILRLMLDYGHLSQEEYDNAVSEECILVNAIPSEESHYIDFALDEAANLLGISREELLSSGYSIYTAMDTAANESCIEILNDGSLYPNPNAQGGLVLIRADGSIAAMCGERGEYSTLGLNRAVDIERQPGSLIKPILCYSPAIEMFGYTAATVLDDSPMDFGGYSPRNSGDKYMGKVTLRQAVAKSLNIPAVDVLANIGLPSARLFAEGMGVSFENEGNNLALALGGFTYGVSPLEMAGAYSVFSRGGTYIKPYSVLRITSGEQVLYEAKPSATRAMSEETAFIMTSILQSAVDDGTAHHLSTLGIPVAAKTGTNLDANGLVRDAWTAAYTTEYTAVMWMGTDSSEYGFLPEGTNGGNSACIVVSRLLESLYANSFPADFQIPKSVGLYALDAEVLKSEYIAVLATNYTPEIDIYREYFSAATAPKDVSAYWLYPSPPSHVGWYMDAKGNPVIFFTADDSRLEYAILRKSPEGTEQELAKFTGRSGKVEFTDYSAESGKTYQYYVIAIHPDIVIDGSSAVSKHSRIMRVYVMNRLA